MNSFLKYSFYIILVIFINSSHAQDLKELQKMYSDSIGINPSFCKHITEQALNNSEITLIEKALWQKQKGVCYYQLKAFDEAKKQYFLSFSMYQQLRDTLGMSKNLTNIGICFNESYQNDSALVYYKKAYDLLEFTDFELKNTILMNRTKILLDKELYASALENGFEILSNLKENKQYFKGKTYLMIALSFSGLFQKDSALLYYQKSLNIFEVIEHKPYIIMLELNLASDLNYMHQYDKGYSYLKKAKKQAKEWNIHAYDDFILKSLGAYHYNKANYNKAKELYLNAIDTNDLGNPTNVILLQDIAFTEYELGNYKSAYLYFKRYFNANDSLINKEVKLKLLEIEEQYEAKEKQNKIDLLAKDNEILMQTKALNELEIEKKKTKLSRQNVLYFSLLAIAVFLAIVIITILNKRKIKAEKKQLEFKNKQLNIERKLIQSQMNPHFIFNSLNSIQRYISENDDFSAQIYLARFGKLMRAILEQTRKDEITLEEEIKTLNLYITLEQLRFSNKFDATITTNATSNDMIFIPPMIAQPFVENAILHGFGNIDYQGSLKIHFEIEKTQIVCTIEDNGLGRKEAKKITEKKQKNHNSLAIQVTKERLASNKTTSNENNIIYTDLEKGTSVTVYIKQQNEL